MSSNKVLIKRDNRKTVKESAVGMVKNDKANRLFITSIEKGMLVLLAFNVSRRKMSLTEISAHTGLDISSVQRCAHTLTELGYLRRDAQSRRYELSIRVMDFAFRYLSSNELVNHAFPFLQQLSNEIGETVNLAVLDDTEIVILLRFTSQHVLVKNIMVSTRLPAYCTSTGLVMLTNIRQEQAEDIIGRSELRQYTPHTVVDPKEILLRLDGIRKRGYSIIHEESHLGDISMSSAITDLRGDLLGAVTVAVSKSRWRGSEAEGRIADCLISTVGAII